MDIHLKNFLKNFIPIGPYCHEIGDNKWCHFYKSTWKKTIKNHIRNRNECKWDNVCSEDCNVCDEDVSYCQFCNIIEYGDYPLGDGCKICGQNEYGVLEDTEKDNIIHNDSVLNFYMNNFKKIKNRGANI